MASAETPLHGGERGGESLKGDIYDRLVVAWREALERCDPHLPSFREAVRAFGTFARSRGAGAADVLRALNGIIDPKRGGDAALDFDSVRERAGSWAIASFYRDD